MFQATPQSFQFSMVEMPPKITSIFSKQVSGPSIATPIVAQGPFEKAPCYVLAVSLHFHLSRTILPADLVFPPLPIRR